MKVVYSLFIFIFCFTACSLERNNPLDPKGNPDVIVPPTPEGVVSASVGTTIRVQWKRTENAELVDHYKLYRASHANGPYSFLLYVYEFGQDDVIAIDESVVSGLVYFYKVSGVSPPVLGTNPPRGLEGRLSEHCDGQMAGGG